MSGILASKWASPHNVIVVFCNRMENHDHPHIIGVMIDDELYTKIPGETGIELLQHPSAQGGMDTCASCKRKDRQKK